MVCPISGPEPPRPNVSSVSEPIYQLRKPLQVFAQINNVLHRHYYTAAQLGPTGFTDQGTFIAQPLSAVNGNVPFVHATFYARPVARLAYGAESG
jgi:hypothetical protein